MSLISFLTGTRSSLLKQSLAELGVMLDTADTMFAAATDNLLENEALTVDLAAMDDIVNECEMSIRRAVLQHLISDPREALSLSLQLISIVQDAERCGDLAKTIAKASALATAPRMGRHVNALRPIRDRVQPAFSNVHRAFLDGDVDAGRAVMEEHAQTKAELAGYFAELASADDVSSNEAVVLALSARMIGRTSSHLSNIISAVTLPFDRVRNAPDWATES